MGIPRSSSSFYHKFRTRSWLVLNKDIILKLLEITAVCTIIEKLPVFYEQKQHSKSSSQQRHNLITLLVTTSKQDATSLFLKICRIITLFHAWSSKQPNTLRQTPNVFRTTLITADKWPNVKVSLHSKMYFFLVPTEECLSFTVQWCMCRVWQ